MSSVGGRDGSDSEVRRLREQYKQREEDLIKKHSKEVRNLTQSNQTEIEKLREQNELRVKDMREKSRETMSRRDSKYQNQMNRMREIQTKQLDRLLKDNETKLNTQRSTSNAEVKQAKLGNEGRVEQLDQKYRDSIASHRDSFERQIDDARNQQQRSLSKFKENINEQKEEQFALQKDYYDRRLMEVKNELRTTRHSSKQRLTDKEVSHNRDKMRMNETFMDEMRRRDVSSMDLNDTQRKNFQSSLTDLRQEARVAHEEARKDAYAKHEDLKAKSAARVEGREKRLEREIGDLKSENIRDRIKYKQGAQNEIRERQKAYDRKYDLLEEARRDTLNQTNDTMSKNVKVIRQEASDVIQANTRYLQNQNQTSNFKSKQALEQKEQEYKLRTDYQRNSADKRINRIRENSFVENDRQYDAYKKNIEEMKKIHKKDMQQARLSMEKEKTKQVAALKTQIQKAEVEHSRVMDSTVQKYEKRIAELNDQFTREKRLSGNREKQLTEAMQRAADSSQEIVKLKYEEKFQKSLEQHNDEKRKMAVSHKSLIDNIMSQARKA